MNFFYKLYKYLIDYLFPYRCLKCFSYTQDEDGLCSSCFSSLHFNSKPFCIICGKGFNIDIDKSNLCGPCTVKKPIYDQARFITSSIINIVFPLISYFLFTKKLLLIFFFLSF